MGRFEGLKFPETLRSQKHIILLERGVPNMQVK